MRDMFTFWAVVVVVVLVVVMLVIVLVALGCFTSPR